MTRNATQKAAHIDLTHLRSITEGDRELEEKLFALFFETSERCIRTMGAADSCTEQGWKDAAHELKGASASVGAEELQNLCMAAEHLPVVDTKHRQRLLQQLHDAFARAKQFYSELHS